NANTVIGGTGEGAGGDNDPYKGLLDDLRLYDRVQTALEIQTDMITPAGGSGALATYVPPTEPLAASAAGAALSPPAPAVLRVYPNPFRGSTWIEARGDEGVAVYDISGRLVRKWRASGVTGAAGILRVDWDGTDLRGRRIPAGIYFAKAGRKIVRVALLR
ncbi:MAG: T9SS type A sorting domain-containing protein, partial [Candidatus Eisenbacteria bacterium]